MKSNIHAFSLIELMIVIAIIGIISATAIPAYQNYVIRSQVAEGLVALSKYQKMATEYYFLHGTFPNASQIGLATSGENFTVNTNYISGGVVRGGTANGTARINVYVANTGRSGTFSIESFPRIEGGAVNWYCMPSGNTVVANNDDYFPATCRDAWPF